MAYNPSNLSVTKKYFSEDVCRNCGADLTGNYCIQCGQSKVKRITYKFILDEIWQALRWFEMELVQAAYKLLTKPGLVAREYVMGMRKKHQHPLKLLLVALGILMLVIDKANYIHSADTATNRVIELVKEYGKWSFSLGIIAITVGTLTVFWKRLRYNFTEHLVLATYCHFVIIALNILNLLPNLFINDAQWQLWHKHYSQIYMDIVDVVILAIAFTQFFFLRLRTEWWKLLIALVLYISIKRGLIYLYAWLLVKLIMNQIIK
ncbi:DUF3667 domain-containing protein [Xanthocytophaga flava]|uniref:DUF3667 domain-containing protein n=1 Tax=Xanthocytophaga flava TaxID=3048013 RepID=UPI0028D8BF51|nr:DUF3667 domain-containing protein [Xanthocytophaga flavus]MDJ1468575.1 DUF3667 domain-containing protein [Xanthocytophaga flavus]